MSIAKIVYYNIAIVIIDYNYTFHMYVSIYNQANIWEEFSPMYMNVFHVSECMY